MPGAQV